MNPLNYATPETSQRLRDTGIVLETEHYWYKDYDGTWKMSNDLDEFVRDRDYVSAPSLAEVWRELSSITIILNEDGVSIENGRREFKNTNPTDALIDLLIWVTEQKRKEK